MENSLDQLINNEVDKNLAVEEGGENGTTQKSGLRILSTIFVVLGFIILIPTVIYMFKSFDRERFLIPFVSCLAGSVFFLFNGFVGNCLDDIRNNTKKK